MIVFLTIGKMFFILSQSSMDILEYVVWVLDKDFGNKSGCRRGNVNNHLELNRFRKS